MFCSARRLDGRPSDRVEDMARGDTHLEIIRSECFLYGTVIDVPKVFDADTKYHSPRPVRGGGSARIGADSGEGMRGLSDRECERLERLAGEG